MYCLCTKNSYVRAHSTNKLTPQIDFTVFFISLQPLSSFFLKSLRQKIFSFVQHRTSSDHWLKYNLKEENESDPIQSVSLFMGIYTTTKLPLCVLALLTGRQRHDGLGTIRNATVSRGRYGRLLNMCAWFVVKRCLCIFSIIGIQPRGKGAQRSRPSLCDAL